MTTVSRTQHPFYMYDAITAQPDVFADVIRRTRLELETITPRVTRARRIFIVGLGTSFHTAQIGYYLFRHYGVTAPIQVFSSFDFVLYGPDLTVDDCVITVTHRGAKQYSLDAIKKARQAGCYTLLITGEGKPVSVQYADALLKTTPQEKSSAHTMSYTGSVAALAAMGEAVGQHQSGNVLDAPAFLQQELPDILRVCLQKEENVKALAAQHLQHRRIWLVGGGPGAIVAQESALKIKETSYLQAEGMQIETMLHGPFQCAEEQDLFILIAPSGLAQRRVAELGGMVKEIGASYIVVGDGTTPLLQQDAAGWINVPQVAEPFTGLTCLIPLQLFTYYLALNRGTNPDGFRQEDPRFAIANKLVVI